MAIFWGEDLMQIRALWLGFSLPDELMKEVFLLDPMPAIQTHKFGWSFARALKQAFGEVTLASTCPVQSYPLVNQLVFRGGDFTFQGMNGVKLGFVNLLLLKHATRFVACLLSVTTLIKSKQINWIFVHGLHTPHLIFSLFSRLLGCRVVVVLTDPPGGILASDKRWGRFLKQMDAWLIGRILIRIDAVIALAPELATQLAPNCPAMVFPGILESTLDVPVLDTICGSRDFSNARPSTIVYAGGLSEAYGVDRLVEAVLSLEHSAVVQLKLYGRGDQELNIQRLAETEPRIIYGGFIGAETLFPELCAADLLVNPRPTSELFATLSFPSKLIEYLATGRPVLTTRIPSIPDSLSNHFHFIEDESAAGIGRAIQNVMNIPVDNRLLGGLIAQQFVRTHLSEVATGQRIAEFVKKLI